MSPHHSLLTQVKSKAPSLPKQHAPVFINPGDSSFPTSLSSLVLNPCKCSQLMASLGKEFPDLSPTTQGPECFESSPSFALGRSREPSLGHA